MSAWDKFVQRTLIELRNGAHIPAYFGPLIALLSQEQSQSTIAEFPEEEEQEVAPDDELLNEEEDNTQIEEFTEEAPKQEPSLPVKQKATRTDEDDTAWFNSTRNAKNPPPAIHESDDSSFEAIPQTTNQIIESESEPPIDEPIIEEEEADEEYNVDVSETADQEIEPEPSRQSYADYFRQVGDMVFGKYWYPMESTVIPRMTLESKLMTTFRVSKFERLKGVMIDQGKRQASNKLRFSRRREEEEDVDEYDE